MFLQRVASYLHVPNLVASGRRSRTGSIASGSGSRPGSRASGGGDSNDSSRRSSYHLGESFSRIGVLSAGLPGLGIIGFDPMERRDSARRRRAANAGGASGVIDGSESPAGSMSRISELSPPQVQIHEADEDRCFSEEEQRSIDEDRLS